jgi:hypothetical protein
MGSSMTARSITILFAILAGTIFASCSREDAVTSNARKEQVSNGGQTTLQKPRVPSPTLKDPSWVILPGFSEWVLTALGAQGTWQPTDSDVRQAIHDLRPYLERFMKTPEGDDDREQIEEILADWGTYACQAVGYTKDGKKFIHLNFLPKTEKDWRRAYIGVCDGGASYWRIEYDKNAKSFSHFEANGVA